MGRAPVAVLGVLWLVRLSSRSRPVSLVLLCAVKALVVRSGRVVCLGRVNVIRPLVCSCRRARSPRRGASPRSLPPAVSSPALSLALRRRCGPRVRSQTRRRLSSPRCACRRVCLPPLRVLSCARLGSPLVLRKRAASGLVAGLSGLARAVASPSGVAAAGPAAVSAPPGLARGRALARSLALLVRSPGFAPRRLPRR